MREQDVFCACTYIARAEKRGGVKIRLVYLDRFFMRSRNVISHMILLLS